MRGDLAVHNKGVGILSPTTSQTVPGGLPWIAEGLLVIFARTRIRCSTPRRIDGDLDRRDGTAATEIDGGLGWNPSAYQGPGRSAGAVADVGGGGSGEGSHVACLVGVGGVVAGNKGNCPGWVARWCWPAGRGRDGLYVCAEDICAGT